MSYFWKQCGDPYQRIEAWKSSHDVYVLMKEGWFWDTQTNIRVRFLPTQYDVELMIGNSGARLNDAFIKLSVIHKTDSDIAKQAAANRVILEREGLAPEDLLKASTRELERFRRKEYVANYKDALENLCKIWFGR